MFTEPVYIDGNNLLVPAKVEIRKKDISRLHTWGIEFVETNGEMIHADPKAKAQAQVTSLPDVFGNSEAYRTYISIVDNMNEVCNNLTAGISVEARYINMISSRLLKGIRDQRSSFIGFILGGEIKGREMAKSLINTAILSALIAMELKQPHHKVLHIVTGALLHDVGMLRLPKALLEKRGGLSPVELERIKSHTLHSFKIVGKEMQFPSDVGTIVLQHHERWDGEGYPGAISGEAIDLGARIVSVADAFEAMISQKPYRNSMIGYQAMKNLLSDNLRRFDPNVIKAFITTLGIYPIGSIILLNNGAYARVVDVKSTAPLRPKIRILIDESGKVFRQDEGSLIDLLENKGLFITRAVDPKEIAGRDG